MQFITQKDLDGNEDLKIHRYLHNVNVSKVLIMLIVFLAFIAALVYPFSHFEPRQWMLLPIALALICIYIYYIVYKWRNFAARAYVAYDKEYLYIANKPNRICKIKWDEMTSQNMGFHNEEDAGILHIQIDGQKTDCYLVSSFVMLNELQDLMAEMLTHIKENKARFKDDSEKPNQASEETEDDEENSDHANSMEDDEDNSSNADSDEPTADNVEKDDQH